MSDIFFLNEKKNIVYIHTVLLFLILVSTMMNIIFKFFIFMLNKRVAM